LGNNIFNPALVGRVFLLISFPAYMTTWPEAGSFPMTYLDAQTSPTTLSLIQYGEDYASVMASAIGLTGGSIGEISETGLLLGFIFLLYRKIITWHIPVAILGTAVIFIVLLYTGTMFQTWQTTGITDIYALMDSAKIYDPLMHLTSGGLMLGAIFMATDYATSPMSKKAMVVYGISIGILTVLIRIFGDYPEGISFAILIMNGLTPLMNMYMKPKHFGGK
jgi:electron transport complex protein RnfD